jgi:hypothetical protein
MELVFVSYRELGDQLAIHSESARRLIERQGWEKDKGKDGRMGAWVPDEELRERQAPMFSRLRARIRHGEI